MDLQAELHFMSGMVLPNIGSSLGILPGIVQYSPISTMLLTQALKTPTLLKTTSLNQLTVPGDTGRRAGLICGLFTERSI